MIYKRMTIIELVHKAPVPCLRADECSLTHWLLWRWMLLEMVSMSMINTLPL